MTAWPTLLANVVRQGEFSLRVLVTLLAVLVLSGAAYALLVRRWTTQRNRVVLSDWAKGKGFRIGNPERMPPQATALLGELKARLRARMWLEGDETALLAVEGEAEQAPAAPVVPAPVSDIGAPRWHVLVRELPIESQWKPTGLRPAHARSSFLDLYSLSSYPALGNVERFVIFGTDTHAARTLSKSHARGLLPPDIGLLLHGKQLVLDFSSRPFDPIEFDRMLALADQLVAQLPMPR